MKLTRENVETALKSYHSRTAVGDNVNPLRRVLQRLGATTVNLATSPRWLRTFVERAQTRNARTLSAGAALNILATIK